MSSEVVIRATSLSKGFESYSKPADRLKRSVYGLLGGIAPLATLRRRLLKHARSCVRMFWALKDVDFEIARGETVGIIGRNGSGKSTLLQIVCGTLAPTTGDVRTNGRIAALLELGSGFDAEYTGRENIYINGQLHGLTREQIDARVEDIIAFADIGHFIDQPVKIYSSGMFVRLAFAVIAHVDADILVVDEALAVGDAFFTQKCMRFLRRFQQTGTVLFVSHDASAIRGLCDRVIWLDRGQILESGSAKAVCTHYFEAFYKQQQGEGVTWQHDEKVSAKASVDQAERVSDIATADQRLLFPLRQTVPVPQNTGMCIDPHTLPIHRTRELIESAHLTNENGSPITWVMGSEHVVLRILVRRPNCGSTPTIAFFVKDRLGEPLFGDDTSFAQVADEAGAHASPAIMAEFRFDMPILPPGEYAFSVFCTTCKNGPIEVADCIHDALIVKSEASRVATGLIGVPMSRIDLYVRESAGEI
ncbi:ABC transporter ATP-binding protein [Burkholderia sp. MSMB1552]|uniref:ABC transporter ATP-binding protein n=3 Tax=Burkholderia TaxID=32008 RepID=A0A7U4P2F9_9BURK|nr:MULTISPECIES: ABC transporter ATP-binding protein [Burkholderia]AJY43894.1 ABC transporter family protein [Burkholderia sp. 2002721687]ALX41758.1 ABC transporter ATP-binding protein [Burkholderia humptydooensis]KVN13301.1 ABC transporter ATP-binding protein [Burkholderia sp. MSMB1552]KWZ56722.1 ABC transporter ATP-binding protein [Burkholderia sp. MSMB1588]QPS43071.1 ABC transporter ATP-binding protein [Burkholderia humptydooensis]